MQRDVVVEERDSLTGDNATGSQDTQSGHHQLSIYQTSTDDGAATTTNVNSDDGPTSPPPSPMGSKILKIIRSIPNHTIRPGRIAAELGISVEDASAELCGLLKAVGGGPDGASFRFEQVTQPGITKGAGPSATTMVFTFPADFERRAMRQRRNEDLRETARKIMIVAVKVVKIVTAFGLILSLLILAIAAFVALIAALVALSRTEGGGHRHRTLLIHRVRTLFFSVRQMLWCYALFGPSDESEDGSTQDPFLREVAYDLWLCCSVCCGHPGSIFFWMRANQLQRRRQRLFRGWGRQNNNMESDIPGIMLVRRGDDSNAPVQNNSGQPHRGLLSIAVEFLFGPTPFTPGPSVTHKWILRAAALVQASTKNQSNGATAGVSLQEMAPYVDYPPASVNDAPRIVEQGLSLVAHFNGQPVQQNSANEDGDITKAVFVFPELIAESSTSTSYEQSPEIDDGSFASLLYAKESATADRRSSAIPTFLKEDRYRFTHLTAQQLTHCVVLGSLNLIGVIWFRQSVSAGGVIFVPADTPLGKCLFKGLLPVLWFYALLFFALPTARLLLVVMLNGLLTERNSRRARFVAHTLGSA